MMSRSRARSSLCSDDVTPARRHPSRFGDLTIESLDEVLVSLGRELQETQSELQDHFEKLSWLFIAINLRISKRIVISLSGGDPVGAEVVRPTDPRTSPCLAPLSCFATLARVSAKAVKTFFISRRQPGLYSRSWIPLRSANGLSMDCHERTRQNFFRYLVPRWTFEE
jgi:hypothetical protein